MLAYGLQERYVMATEQMEKAKAAMEAAKAESKRKDKLLDDRDKEWTALQVRGYEPIRPSGFRV